MRQKILIVDDKPENLFTLENIINENLDVEVVKAENGNEALKMFLHNNFSLAILDVQMPEMDGYELASYIRNRKHSRSTPIIFLSAIYSDDFHVFRGYECGGVDFISKPFNINLLVNKIRFFIRLKEEEIKRKEIEDNLQELVKERTGEMEKAIKEAKRANLAKSTFLATMSHEIRTPLHAMLGMVDILAESRLTDRQKEYLNTVHDAGKLLLSIISDILDFSKIEAGKLEFELIDFNIDDLIRRMINIYKIRTDEKNISIIYENKFKDELILKGDPVRLGQIINNLLSNSAKFTEKGTIKVVLDARKSGQKYRVFIDISDTGIGIEESKIKNLFMPFTQEDSSTTRMYGGSGLGLSIVKKIIDLLGGDISVKSEKGRGTAFSFSLMFDKGTLNDKVNNRVSKNETIKDADKTVKESPVILVAEDIKFNQLFLNEILSSQNCEFTITENGLEAVNEFNKGKYNIILMDARMPVMDGYEATRKIRAMEKGKNVPIIALTADSVAGAREKFFENGMNDYLCKPFSKTDFIKKLSLWCPLLSSKVTEYDSIISMETLKKLHSDVGSEIYTLINCFIEMTAETVDNIVKLQKENNIKELAKHIHDLKGSCSNMGINAISEICENLLNNINEIPENKLKQDLDKVLSLLRSADKKLKEIYESRSLS